MLGVKAYPAGYILATKAKFEADVEKYDAAVAKAGTDATAAFEASYFNNLVCLLDFAFVHRLRTVEGKDGNSMNEVRMLANSILESDCILAVEKSIKWVPEKTVLKLAPGATIALSREQFDTLSIAYFDQIAAKFS